MDAQLSPDSVQRSHREEVYDGRGHGSRGGLVRELLQRRRWQLHQVGLLGWTDKEIRDLVGSLQFFEKLKKLSLFGNEVSDTRELSLWPVRSRISSTQACRLEAGQQWSRGRGCQFLMKLCCLRAA